MVAQYGGISDRPVIPCTLNFSIYNAFIFNLRNFHAKLENNYFGFISMG